MKILFVTTDFYHNQNNNTHLIKKLLPYLVRRSHQVHILSSIPETVDTGTIPALADYTLHLSRDSAYSLYRNPLTRKLVTLHYARNLAKKAKTLHREFGYDLILTTHYPSRGVSAVSLLPDSYPKMLYLMDPPEFLFQKVPNEFMKKKVFAQYLKKNHSILTTPFIRRALTEKGLGKYDPKITEIGFPILERNPCAPVERDIVMSGDKINLLFCGTLHPDIRSPRYFLDLVSRLDERFCVYFVGQYCQHLHRNYPFQTKAQVVTLANQPYQVALNAMNNADILINIGNSVSVHIPSKTLEYINTGKPIVNLRKLPDCTTLHYTKRYPLCLDLPEYDPDLDGAAEKLVAFCLENRGKAIDTSGISEIFPECTPEYIADVIISKASAHGSPEREP